MRWYKRAWRACSSKWLVQGESFTAISGSADVFAVSESSIWENR